MQVEFTVQGSNITELRAAVRRRLDELGEGIEWRQMRLDIRPAVDPSPGEPVTMWLGDFLGTDEPEVAEGWG